MRLVSIINVWACCADLLPSCIKNHLQFCDGVIVVWSSHSNHFNYNDSILKFILDYKNDGRVEFIQQEPLKAFNPLTNETRKRNAGIEVAKAKGYTHFLVSDADEFWIPEEMNQIKKRFDNPNLNGLVHPLKVYIKSPTLWCSDHTLVPGIHKMKKDSYVGSFKEYPFAYDSQGNAHIDPSRRPNYLTGIEPSTVFMHHLSYVRKDIDLKIDNSSANLRRSRQVIYDELRDAKPGYVSRLYHKPLQESMDFFDIEL